MPGKDFINEWFNAYQHTSGYRDDNMLNIAMRKEEFEDQLNEMWHIYSTGQVRQIIEYNKQVSEIKRYGYKVMRNSEGKHKIVLGESL